MTRQTTQKLLFWINLLNIFCLPLAFYHNTWNFGNKWDLSPFHSTWEFFTVWWCVWNSFLIFIYSWRETSKFNNPSNKKVKKNGKLGLVTAIASLTSIIGFTLNLLWKIFWSQKSLNKLPPPVWWAYTFTWHYLVFILFLVYFFKYSEEINLTKKELLIATTPFPVIFFLTNLVRNFLSSKKYFGQKPFLGNVIWWFHHLESGYYWSLLAWIVFSIFYFWATAYLLLWIKRKWFNFSTKKKLKLRRNLFTPKTSQGR
jgi:hypothetical protein